MKEIYFKSQVVTISYDEGRHLGKAEWIGFLSSDEFRQNGLRCVELINEKGIQLWLADQRQMKAIRQLDQKWFVDELLPRLLASPLNRMAIVVSGDIFNNMAMEQMIRRSGDMGDLVLREFDEEADALEWLFKQEMSQESRAQDSAPVESEE